MRVGTVFSGIGSIEHALLRMNIDHELVFACDNGDVDIFTKKIDVSINAIEEEFCYLEKLVQKYDPVSVQDHVYKNELESSLTSNQKKYEKICNILDAAFNEHPKSYIYVVLEKIAVQKDIKKLRLKEYNGFLQSLKKDQKHCSIMLKRLQYAVACVNDFKKDNGLDALQRNISMLEVSLPPFKSTDNIDWNPVIEFLTEAYLLLEFLDGKSLIRQIRDISERLGMLHEKINLHRLRKQIDNVDDYSEKKKIIDRLYEPHLKQNQVRKSYLANYELDPKKYHWNISFLDGRQYRDQIDLFVGGSPCQSFSMVGKQRGLEDTRGTLFYEYARLVDEIRPKVFIYENVKAVLKNDNGRTWKTMQKVFEDLGYMWKCQVMNARNYGIPQNRERVFVVGFREDILLEKEFCFPEPIELNTTMKDFLLDNVSGKYYLNKKGADFVTLEKNLIKKYTQIDGTVQLCQKKNQQFNWHGDFVFVEENYDMEKTMEDLEKYFLSEKVCKYVLASGTKNFYSKSQTDLDIARPLLTTMHKMHRAGIDNYVTTEGRLRKLTPRECLRLMGYCDSFKIVVSDTAVYQQAGNSIVVDVLIAVMKEILKVYPKLEEDIQCVKVIAQ